MLFHSILSYFFIYLGDESARSPTKASGSSVKADSIIASNAQPQYEQEIPRFM